MIEVSEKDSDVEKAIYEVSSQNSDVMSLHQTVSLANSNQNSKQRQSIMMLGL